MDNGTLGLFLIVALVVVVLLLLVRAAGSVRRSHPRLRPLAADSRDAYINDWDEIEAKFVDSPEQAVREAQALAMSVMRERGHPLTERDMPAEMQRAHKLAYSRKGTEGLRQALLQYRSLMERMVGREEVTRREERRREMA